MVGEYPLLQEYMAREYFGDSPAFVFVALCYDLEKLAGMFGAGEIPTGSKDPHGLRRNALEVARAFGKWRDIKAAVAAAFDSFGGKVEDKREEVYEFILDRIRFLFLNSAPSANAVDAALSLKPTDLRNLDAIVECTDEFAKTGEAKVLAAANKRINNILRKSADAGASALDESLFCEDAERGLHKTIREWRKQTDAAIAQNEFGGALPILCGAAAPADKFFDEVLVNAEDAKVRANRFALLRELRALLNRVADLSALA